MIPSDETPKTIQELKDELAKLKQKKEDKNTTLEK